MTSRKNRFSLRLADEILDLPWRVPAADLGVTLLRSLNEPSGLRQVLQEHPVLALPELAREIDARLAREQQVSEEDLPLRLEPYLRELRESEPVEYVKLLAGCVEHLLSQRVRSRQASMRAVELGELSALLLSTGEETQSRQSAAPQHQEDEGAWARQPLGQGQLAASASGSPG
ncbi:MAG TPA: hypothetical protein VK009_24255 [Chloroflexota bacterium]|nr:hypothetical protein [Chloroflexota bacterium]